MGRAFDFVVIGVVWTICVLIHYISILLFQPGSPLWRVATDGTEVVNGAARATLWFEALSVYIPLLVAGGIVAWAFAREYRRQAVTAVSGPP
jgi:hypothetical protein